MKCPNCGGTISGLGRKSLTMPFINVCDAVREHSTVGAAAEKLGCSRSYIYKVLKSNGLTVKGLEGR